MWIWMGQVYVPPSWRLRTARRRTCWRRATPLRELRLASYFRIGSSILGFFSAPPLIANGERERFPPFRGQRVDGGERCKRPGGQRPAPHDTAEVRWCRTPGGRAASCWNPPHTRTRTRRRRRESPGPSLPVLVSGFVGPQPGPSSPPSPPLWCCSSDWFHPRHDAPCPNTQKVPKTRSLTLFSLPPLHLAAPPEQDAERTRHWCIAAAIVGRDERRRPLPHVRV